MKLPIAVGSILFLFFSLAHAQADFRPGFIITLQRDTMEGFVAFQGNKRNSIRCKFKTSLTEKATIYEPSELVAYGFSEGRYYIADSIIDSKNSSGIVFYETLIAGKATLLRYNSRLFIKKEESLPLELKKIDELIVVDGKRGIVTKKDYVGLLNASFRECSNIVLLVQQTANLGLLPKKIVPLFEEYNQCVQSEYQIFNVKQPWLRAVVSLAGGLSVSDLQFSAEETFDARFINNSRFNTTLQPTFGVQLNVSSPKLDEKFSLSVEAWYVRHQFEGYSEYTYFGATNRHNLYVDVTSLKFPMLLTYHYPVGLTTAYARLGLIPNYQLEVKSRNIHEQQYENVVKTNLIQKEQYDQLSAGIGAGVGLNRRIHQRQSIFLEARFEQVTNTFTKAFPVAKSAAAVNHFSLFIGITF